MVFRGGRMCFVIPDQKLGNIVGNEPLPTSQMIKKLWEYIRANCKTEVREIAKVEPCTPAPTQ